MGEEGALEGIEGVDGRPPAAGGVGKEALPHELAVRVASSEFLPDAKEVVEGEDRGGRKLEEDGEGGRAVAVLTARHARLEVVEDGDGEGAGGVEDDVGNGEVGGQVVGPAEEEVREEGGGRVGMGSGLAEDVGAEEGECATEGEGGARGGEVVNVLDADGARGGSAPTSFAGPDPIPTLPPPSSLTSSSAGTTTWLPTSPFPTSSSTPPAPSSSPSSTTSGLACLAARTAMAPPPSPSSPSFPPPRSSPSTTSLASGWNSEPATRTAS